MTGSTGDSTPGGASDRTGVSPYADRIEELAARAARDREAFEPPAAPPDEERALECLTRGAGPALLVYVDAHAGGTHDPFSGREYATLERTMNEYLELYARCYGAELSATFTLRAAAELLLDTRDVTDVAQLLTHVPPR